MTKSQVLNRCTINSFLWGLLLMNTMGHAQNTKAQLSLFINPPPETILVNDSVLKFGNKISLDTGDHRLRFWSPGYSLVDTTINLSPGEQLKFYYILQESAHYNNFLKEHRKFVDKRHLYLDLPLLTTSLLLASSTYFYISAQKSYEATGKALEDYRYATTSIDDAYSNYQDVSDQYRKDRVLFYASAGLTLVSAYFLYRGFKWLQKKGGGPEFVPRENPLVLNTMYLSPVNSQTGRGILMGLNFSLD